MILSRALSLEVLDLLRRTADAFGDQFRGRVQAIQKGRRDFDTHLDAEVNRLLGEGLRALTPEVEVFSEESGDQWNNGAREQRWIVDPIDGSANLLMGIAHFAISIALEQEGKVVAGYVMNPLTRDVFWADVFGPAYLNSTEIATSAVRAVSDAFVVFGFSAHWENINRYRNEWHELFEHSKKALGALSPSLNICAVAMGRSDVFVDFGCSMEGQAAGGFILQKAGGRIFNYDLTEWDHRVKGVACCTAGFPLEDVGGGP